MCTLDAYAGTWAGDELRYLDLGDARRKARAVALLEAQARRPDATLPEACPDLAAVRAAYRFLENAAVTPEALRTAHHQRTRDRVRAQSLTLLLQDTTELDYATHPATTGLGPLACARRQGLHVHSTLAVTPEGVPLGLVDQQIWARDAAEHGKAKQRRTRAQAEKESQRWLDALAASHQDLSPTVATLTIADREADIHALFAAPRPAGAQLLIRGVHDRRVTDVDGTLTHVWAALQRVVPDARTLVVQVPRGHTGATRTARLSVRRTTLALHPPRRARGPAVAVQAILVTEVDPPAGVAPIQWLLLTTLPVPDHATALQCVRWYALRWRIERYHYVLKSGCQIERLQLESADALLRALALYSLVAVRVLHLTYAARETPTAPATDLFTLEELAMACAAITHRRLAADAVPTLATATRWLAQLGGFLGRTGDGPPGAKVIWRGLRRLDALVEGGRLALLALQSDPHPDKPPLVGNA
jgi:hypothetical protein